MCLYNAGTTYGTDYRIYDASFNNITTGYLGSYFNSQLDAAKKTAAAKPVDSAEVKQLRADLADAKSQAEKARSTQQSEAAKLQQQTKDLTSQLETAKKAAAAKPVESEELKKLRAELAEAKKAATVASASPKVVSTSAPVQNFGAAAPVAAKQPADDQAITNLRKQNAELVAQLDAAKKAAAVQPGESTEVKKLRTDLAAAKSEADKARNEQQTAIAKLQQQNQDLASQLETSKKAAAKPAAPAVTPVQSNIDKPSGSSDAGEVQKLRDELARVKAEAELAKKTVAKPSAGTIEELNQLRPAYARARAELEEYKRNVARAEVERVERAALGRHLADLEKMNAQLRDEAASLRRQAAQPKVVAPAAPAPVQSEKPKSPVASPASPAVAPEVKTSEPSKAAPVKQNFSPATTGEDAAH